MNDHARPANMRLLLVEDDLLLGEIVGELLEAQNYDVTRCITVRAALASIHEEPPQLAVLDINIQDEAVFPVADALADAGIPFLFASAAHGFSIPDRHSQRDPLPAGRPTSATEATERGESLGNAGRLNCCRCYLFDLRGALAHRSQKQG